MLSSDLQQQRAGRITASEAYRIMAGYDDEVPKLDEDGFKVADLLIKHKYQSKPNLGDFEKKTGIKPSGKQMTDAWKYAQSKRPTEGMLTYAEELALDSISDADPDRYKSKDMENGDINEGECIRLLGEATGGPFEHTEDNQIHVQHEASPGVWVGATPDGVRYLPNLKFADGGESKCRIKKHHMRHMRVKNQTQLEKEFFGTFCQCQVGMLCLDVTKWYLGFYNPLMHSPFDFGHMLVTRDDHFLKKFIERAEWTYRLRDEFVDQHSTIAA